MYYHGRELINVETELTANGITTTLRWRFSKEFKMAITLIHVRSTHWLAYYIGLCRACWAKDVKFWPTYRTMHVGSMSKLTVIQRNLTTLDREFNKTPTLAQKWLLSVFSDLESNFSDFSKNILTLNHSQAFILLY